MSYNANITVDAIEEQIEESKGVKKNVNNTFNPNDYLDTKLKQGETSRKIRVRILPITEDSNKFCAEVKTHSLKVDKEIAKSGFKSFICLNDEQQPNYDKNIKCPLCAKAFELFKDCKETIQKLKDEGKTEEEAKKITKPLYEKACSFMNKSTYFVRVIQRGKEDEGVKFWRFNKNSKGEGVFDKLIALYKNKKEDYAEAGKDDNYNIFDLNNGRDIIITITRCINEQGKELPPSVMIDTSDFESPLSQDETLVEKWVTDKKRWYNAYTPRPADYLAVIAEDEIPYKKDDKWVAKSSVEEEKTQAEVVKKVAVDEANKVLESDTVEVTRTVIEKPTSVNKIEDIEDDLPF